jgi:hypothetical protein
LFEFRQERAARRGRARAASVAVQVALVAVFFAALQRVTVGRERRPAASMDTALVYLVGPVEPSRARRPGSRDPVPAAPAVAVPAAPDTVTRRADEGPGITGPIVPGPAVGDGRLWVAPRPALPAAVADQLYGPPPERRDSIAIARLRAMVDSLNEFIDEEQRAQRLPEWTVGGEDKAKWGIDSRWIHLGGIKIPTAALALLGDLLPRAASTRRCVSGSSPDMRRDLLNSAWRAQTLQEFQRDVRETRERRRREREEERAHRDTTVIVP